MLATLVTYLTPVGLIEYAASHIQHPYHFLTELVLVIFVIYLFAQRSYNMKKDSDKLTREEEEALLAEWTPAPLVPDDSSTTTGVVSRARVIHSPPTAKSLVEDEEGNVVPVLNFAHTGVLGIQHHPSVLDAAEAACRHYGVGSCGPRGFFGTIQTHTDYEQAIANWMGVDDCVLISSDYQTMTSVIPAFSKLGDVLVIDRAISIPSQSGALLSRSIIKWFDHNDMDDLKRVLDSLAETFAKCKNRVFVVVEGVYMNSGNLCRFDEIMELKKHYPFRIILDESYSLGVIGKTGRGVTELFNIPVRDVEIITASVGNALGCNGGVAFGAREPCDHMRLNCSGYVFSASSPPYLTAGGMRGLEILQEENLPAALQKVTDEFHQMAKHLKSLKVVGSPLSPFVHLSLKNSHMDLVEMDHLLEKIVRRMESEHKILINRAKYTVHEKFPPPPSLKVSVSVEHTLEDLSRLIDTLNIVCAELQTD